MNKLNFKKIAESIKATSTDVEPGKTKSEVEKPDLKGESIKEKPPKDKKKKESKFTRKKKTEQVQPPFEKPKEMKVKTGAKKSLIDEISLTGILSPKAINEILKFMKDEEEIYLTANAKEQLVNVLILDNDLIKNTCLDKTIDHNTQNIRYGLFLQRCELNLRNFGSPGSLFDVNNPLTLIYGTPNQQILLLANVETLNTLKQSFNVVDTEPLKFRIGHMYVPTETNQELDSYIEPLTDAFTIDELPQVLKEQTNGYVYSIDDNLFDFD